MCACLCESVRVCIERVQKGPNANLTRQGCCEGETDPGPSPWRRSLVVVPPLPNLGGKPTRMEFRFPLESRGVNQGSEYTARLAVKAWGEALGHELGSSCL